MAKTLKAFEKSKFDVDKPGTKEGSKADIAEDKRQMKKAPPFMRKGGKVGRK
jgi:hypothetical protein